VFIINDKYFIYNEKVGPEQLNFSGLDMETL